MSDCRLRRYTDKDESWFVALVTKPVHLEHMGGAHSSATARNLFARCLTHDATSRMLAWAIALNHPTDTLVGHAFLHNIDDKTAEVGFVIDESWWGNGYATAACSMLMDEARRLGRAPYATVDLDHRASQRVLEKAGLQLAGEEYDDDGSYLVYRLRES